MTLDPEIIDFQNLQSFHLIETFITVVACGLRIYDVISDILVALYYFNKDLNTYFSCTLIFILVCPICSVIWNTLTYLHIEEHVTEKKKRRFVTSLVYGLFGFSQLLDILLYMKHLWNLIRNRGKEKYKFLSNQKLSNHEEYKRSGAAILYRIHCSSLIETTLEATPQAILQVYILLQYYKYKSEAENNLIREGLTRIVFCICSSLISYAFTVTGTYNAYAYGSAIFGNNKFTMTRIFGLVTHFFGHLLILCCRMFTLALLASANMKHLIIFLAIQFAITATFTIVTDKRNGVKFSLPEFLAHLVTLVEYLQLVESRYTFRFWGYKLCYFLAQNLVITYCFMTQFITIAQFYVVFLAHFFTFGFGIICLILHNFYFRPSEMGKEDFNIALKYLKPLLTKGYPGRLGNISSSRLRCAKGSNIKEEENFM